MVGDFMYYSRNTEEIAMNINLQSRIGINNAFRIARTEGQMKTFRSVH